MSDDLRTRATDADADAGHRIATDAEAPSAVLPAEEAGTAGQVLARSQWQLFRRKFFRHKAAMVGVVVLAIVTVSAVFAEWVAPYGFSDIDVVNASSPPTLADQHYFGTDRLGRDYFSRVLYGTRTSLLVAGIVATLAMTTGTIVGAIAGYYRGWPDAFLMRFTDLLLTLPGLAILITVSAFVGGGDPIKVAFILAALFWVTLARIVRGTFLSLREKEYIEAARASGASDLRIMFRHMVPNSLGPIIVNATLIVGTTILVEAALSFLGFGVSPPRPALGALISDGRSAMTSAWWLVVMPGLTLVLIVLCINFIGDGLRDALDPTQQETV